METLTRTTYIPTLDGWRALAILGVLACHSADYFFAASGLFPRPRLQAYLFHGAIGVDVFFVLSGFLICSGLAHEFETTGGSINLRAFYVRRVFRIFPPFFVYLVTVTLLAWWGLIVVSKLEIAACLLFFRYFIRGGWYTLHFWTLAAEEHFYLIFPTFLALLGGKRGAAWTFALLVLATGVRMLPGLDPLRYNELIMGAWLALVVRLPALQAALHRVPAATPVLFIALIVYSTVRPLPLYAFTFPLLVGMLMVMTTFTPKSLLGRILENRALRWIGRMSYSLYLWQQLFLVLDVPPSALPLGWVQRWPFAPLGLLTCALVSYYLIERPTVRAGRRLASAFSTPAAINANDQRLIE